MDNDYAPPAVPSNSFFTPLLISMAGIVSTYLAKILYHLVILRYCGRGRRSGVVSQSIPQGGRLPTGVEEKTLETIPILNYSSQKTDIFCVDQSECVVCLGELEDGDMVRLLPSCKHAFHVPCIDEWFLSHNTCPVCRSPIVAPVVDTPASVDGSSSSSIRVVDVQPQNNDHDHVRPCRLLRHCASLMLPRERAGTRGLDVTGLKRSISLDQSFVIINIQKKISEIRGDSSSRERDGLLNSKTFKERSVKQLDSASSKLLRSFSRLGVGRPDGGILPY